ncbi:hypothetical protein BH09VER1_BH09VER1_37120 [soil metagenome]
MRPVALADDLARGNIAGRKRGGNTLDRLDL